MSSEVETKLKSPSPARGGPTKNEEYVHESEGEEYESAEEIEEGDGDDYEEEIEIEVEEEVEDEEDEDEISGEGKGKEKELDHDEDRKNPQFIPKKGYFYEHDDRIHGGGEEEEEEEESKESEIKKVEVVVKKAPKIISDRWSHDLYNENDQTPKSHEELQDRYGYDIRGDDQAPRARRHRRYGRGPNQYTRKWEDEEAYQKNRGGGGGYRGSGRGKRGGGGARNAPSSRRNSEQSYESDFPLLLTKDKKLEGEGESSSVPPPKSSPRGESQGPKGLRGNSNSRDVGSGGRGGGGGRRSDSGMMEESGGDGYRGRGRRGGSGGSGGRRNEFSNRNRYYGEGRRGGGGGGGGGGEFNNNRRQEQIEWEREVEREREEGRNAQKKTNDSSPVAHTSSGQGVVGSGSERGNSAKKSPFTNTEYTGSASLTAHRSQDARNQQGAQEENRNRPSSQESRKDVQSSNNERNEGNTPGRRAPPSGYGEKRFQSPKSAQSNQQQSESSRAPKRFSTQRQQKQQSEGQTVSQQQNVSTQQNTVETQADPPPPPPYNPSPSSEPHISHGTHMPISTPPNSTNQQQILQQPLVPPVTTVVSGYPPSQNYYEQVAPNYEGGVSYPVSGSPVVQSVSPSSLWAAQHPNYSTAPYASPPPPNIQPQQPYDPSSPYIGAQGPPQPIFAPPPHPHPQFIQDPTIINYVPPPGPPPSFAPPPFHAQGYGHSGYGPVNPGPPELYHGGVTYYSTQTQIQRPPHLLMQTKRPKSVLQLVEPPKRGMMSMSPQMPLPPRPLLLLDDGSSGGEHGVYSHPPPPHYGEEGGGGTKVIEGEGGESYLAKKMEETSLNPPQRSKKSPSPAALDLNKTEELSWADQTADMTPINSPTETEKSGQEDYIKTANEGN